MAVWSDLANLAYKAVLSSTFINSMLENQRYLKERADVVDNAALGGTRAWQAIPALSGANPAVETPVAMTSGTEYTVAQITITGAPAGTYRINGVVSAFNSPGVRAVARLRRSTSTTPMLAQRHDLSGTGVAGAHECIYVHAGGDITFSVTITADAASSYQPAGCSLVVTRV